MSIDAVVMKKAVVALLDAIAAEHALGHQQSKAQRYVLTTRGGAKVEIMFQKDEKSPPNLWMLQKAAGPKLIATVPNEPSPASKLRTKRNDEGKLLYGRHSALEKMPQLGEADLSYFTPETLEQVGLIIDRLLSLTAADLT